MYIDKFSLLLLFFLKVSSAETENHHLSKRTLLFPEFTLFQFTYGLTVPAILPKRSINLNGCIQNNFELPFNTSHFGAVPLISAKSEEDFNYDLDKNTFYKYLIDILDRFELNGEYCLLRSICEVAEIPMHIEVSNSLLENIVHYLLTPSEGLTNSSYSLDDIFLDAEHIGKTTGKCYKEFSDCSFSLLDWFTKLFYV